MKRINVVLVLFLVAVLSRLAAVEAVAESEFMMMPSVPEFTVKLTKHPYEIYTTYAVNEYTGENITNLGHLVENSQIELRIMNDPLLPAYYDGEKVQYYYNVRVKGHFGNVWTELYSGDQQAYSPGNLPAQSGLEQTLLTLPQNYPYGSQVDFQVQVSGWHYAQVWIVEHPMMSGPDAAKLGHYEPRLMLHGTSDWSKTQTLTVPLEIPPSTTAPEPNDTGTASEAGLQQNEQKFPTLQVSVSLAAAIVAAVGVLIYVKKRKHEALNVQ